MNESERVRSACARTVCGRDTCLSRRLFRARTPHGLGSDALSAMPHVDAERVRALGRTRLQRAYAKAKREVVVFEEGEGWRGAFMQPERQLEPCPRAGGQRAEQLRAHEVGHLATDRDTDSPRSNVSPKRCSSSTADPALPRHALAESDGPTGMLTARRERGSSLVASAVVSP